MEDEDFILPPAGFGAGAEHELGGGSEPSLMLEELDLEVEGLQKLGEEPELELQDPASIHAIIQEPVVDLVPEVHADATAILGGGAGGNEGPLYFENVVEEEDEMEEELEEEEQVLEEEEDDDEVEAVAVSEEAPALGDGVAYGGASK